MTPSPVVSRTPRASTAPVRPRDALPGGRRRERGAVLVHVAVAMMGLLAFSALTIDLGSLWVARAQAQNAADAGALAGAVALAYVNPTDTDAAQAAAATIAQQHQIWGQTVAPASLQTVAGACPTGSPAVPGTCLQVRISRGTASGTPLPVFFSRLFGVNATDVTASASAKVMVGNATPCPRPIAIPDMWNDRHDTTGDIDSAWTPDDIYDRYPDSGFPVPPPDADVYASPSGSGPGTGMTVTDMVGSRIRRDRNYVWRVDEPLHAGDFLTLDLPRPGGSADFELRYLENFLACGGTPMSVGETFDVVTPHPHFTADGTRALIDSDPGAYWDGVAIRGSSFTMSPRLIAIAVFDPDDFASQVRPGPNVHATVRNIVGLFLEDPRGAAEVQGVVLPMPGMFAEGSPGLVSESAFLRSVVLVR